MIGPIIGNQGKVVRFSQLIAGVGPTGGGRGMMSVSRGLLLGLIAAAAVAQERFPTMPSVHGRMPCGSCQAPAIMRPQATIAPTSEAGERLRVSGHVYEADGVTPAPDVVLFLYHTDAAGLYNQPNDPLNPRLYGWVRADRTGGYQFDTIRPAPYPSHTGPAHIHVHVFGPDRPEWFIDEFRFADDPLLPGRDRALPAELGRFSPVVTLTRGPDGVWTGVRDIKLDRGQAR